MKAWACTCGNIRMTGEVVTNGQDVAMHSIDSQILRRNSLTVFRLHSIEIVNYAKATIRIHGETCNEIVCCQCASRFVTVFTQEGAFASLAAAKQSGEQSIQRNSVPILSRPMNLFVPLRIKKYITYRSPVELTEPSELQQKWNDTAAEELEIMFRRSEEATVGSLQTHAVDDFEL